jgi:hypothetical protein
VTLLNTAARMIREQEKRLDRLALSASNPHRYHEDKSEIRGELRRIANFLEGKVEFDPIEAEPRPAPRRVLNDQTNVVDLAAFRSRGA